MADLLDTENTTSEGLDLTDPRIKELAEFNGLSEKTEKVETETNETSEALEPGEPVQPEGELGNNQEKPTDNSQPTKPKISNREAKRLLFHNKQLQERLDRLEQDMQKKNSAQPAQTPQSKPKRDQFINEEEYIDALTEYKINERSVKANQVNQEEYQKEIQYAKLADTWNAKVAQHFKTGQEQAEYWQTVKQLGDLNKVLTPEINGYIFKNPQGPKMLKYLAERPEVIGVLNEMHQWDLAGSLQKIAEYVAQSTPASKPQRTTNATAPVGKLGVSTVGAMKDINEMSDEELMAAHRSGKLKL